MQVFTTIWGTLRRVWKRWIGKEMKGTERVEVEKELNKISKLAKHISKSNASLWRKIGVK